MGSGFKSLGAHHLKKPRSIADRGFFVTEGQRVTKRASACAGDRARAKHTDAANADVPVAGRTGTSDRYFAGVGATVAWYVMISVPLPSSPLSGATRIVRCVPSADILNGFLVAT